MKPTRQTKLDESRQKRLRDAGFIFDGFGAWVHKPSGALFAEMIILTAGQVSGYKQELIDKGIEAAIQDAEAGKR